jgi:hypothetical protein
VPPHDLTAAQVSTDSLTFSWGIFSRFSISKKMFNVGIETV